MRTDSQAHYEILPDASAVAVAAADRFVAMARQSIDERGSFRVALSGGSTPKRIYPLLVDEPRLGAVDWSRVDFFWGDERAWMEATRIT